MEYFIIFLKNYSKQRKAKVKLSLRHKIDAFSRF